MRNVSAISWWEQVTFDEMIMMSALYWINLLSWIFIVLAHWNSSLRVDISLHSDTLSWSRADQTLNFFLNVCADRREATNTSFIVFDVTRLRLKRSNPSSTALYWSTLTITPLMQYILTYKVIIYEILFWYNQTSSF
jgi:hypothetical protein